MPFRSRTLRTVVGGHHDHLAEQKGVALHVESHPSLPAVSVDADRMTQVLDNLVENALRFTTSGDTIALQAENHPADCLQITVSDTGAGIAPEHLPHILDRFYKVDQARNRDKDSTGLGLAIAKSIIEAHGGTIAVESQLGAGSAFIMTLPLPG